MSAKAISEASGKTILNKFLGDVAAPCLLVSVDEKTSFHKLTSENSWLKTNSLVAKPDQLIKRRGKLGLITVNKTISQVEQWINERLNKETNIGRATGTLNQFIIEPFIPHTEQEEVYICIYSHRNGDTILFHHQGGVDIGDVDSKALKLDINIDHTPSEKEIRDTLLKNVTSDQRDRLTKFISVLYQVYVDQYFTYLEINPLVITSDQIYILDLAAKLDSTAEFICKSSWGDVNFPAPFGRNLWPEEKYIADLDAKSGASFKIDNFK